MSITTETAKTSTGIATVANDPDFVAVALFSALGLLATIYLMINFPFSVEDATFLASLL